MTDHEFDIIASAGVKVGQKLPAEGLPENLESCSPAIGRHETSICLTGLLYSPTSPGARTARRQFWPQEKPQASQVEPYRLDRSGSHHLGRLGKLSVRIDDEFVCDAGVEDL